MILGFKQKFSEGVTLKNKPTEFKPKILAGTKIHSMREDKYNRWKVGMSMQLAHGVRTNQYDHFATKELVSIQQVRIQYEEGRDTPRVLIDGRAIGILELLMLAKNDGFDGFKDFFEYFDTTANYKLLHWTNYRYDGDPKKQGDVNAGVKQMADL